MARRPRARQRRARYRPRRVRYRPRRLAPTPTYQYIYVDTGTSLGEIMPLLLLGVIALILVKK